MKIYGYGASINVRKVLWACEELDLPFVQEDWGGAYRPMSDPQFEALNSVGMVPVIDDDGVVVWESNTIVRYLAASRGRADLLPTQPAARARVEQWMDWQAGDFNNAWRYAFMNLVRKSPAHQDAAAVAASAATWNRHVAILDEQLGRSGAFVAGPDFTLADIVIGLSVNRWFLTPIERPELPRVLAYYDRLAERAPFRLHGCNGMP